MRLSCRLRSWLALGQGHGSFLSGPKRGLNVRVHADAPPVAMCDRIFSPADWDDNEEIGTEFIQTARIRSSACVFADHGYALEYL